MKRAEIVKLAFCLAILIFITNLPLTGESGQPSLPTRVLYVDDSGVDAVDCGTATKKCKTISYALKKAQPETRINVGAGTYNENLVIEKNKTWIVGAGTGLTFITSPLTAQKTIEVYGS